MGTRVCQVATKSPRAHARISVFHLAGESDRVAYARAFCVSMDGFVLPALDAADLAALPAPTDGQQAGTGFVLKSATGFTIKEDYSDSSSDVGEDTQSEILEAQGFSLQTTAVSSQGSAHFCAQPTASSLAHATCHAGDGFHLKQQAPAQEWMDAPASVGFTLDAMPATRPHSDRHEDTNWCVGLDCGTWIGSHTKLNEQAKVLITNATWNISRLSTDRGAQQSN